jgi:hypothetical protein
MGGFSIVHWLILLLIGLLWVIPLARIFKRVGFGWGWALPALFPPFAMVALWVLAFSRWNPPGPGRAA